jgi:hypothetical protein
LLGFGDFPVVPARILLAGMAEELPLTRLTGAVASAIAG